MPLRLVRLTDIDLTGCMHTPIRVPLSHQACCRSFRKSLPASGVRHQIVQDIKLLPSTGIIQLYLLSPGPFLSLHFAQLLTRRTHQEHPPQEASTGRKSARGSSNTTCKENNTAIQDAKGCDCCPEFRGKVDVMVEWYSLTSATMAIA